MAERFGSPLAGIVATLLIVILMFLYLLAQFKAGSKILASLLSDVPLYARAVDLTDSITQRFWIFQGTEPDYVLCLFVFSAAVIFYVVYGGFRAVVWTDVLQGFVMVFGVLVMLVLALYQVGGLDRATEKLAKMTPPEFGSAIFTTPEPAAKIRRIAADTWFTMPDETTGTRLLRTNELAVIPEGGGRFFILEPRESEEAFVGRVSAWIKAQGGEGLRMENPDVIPDGTSTPEFLLRLRVAIAADGADPDASEFDVKNPTHEVSRKGQAN